MVRNHSERKHKKNVFVWWCVNYHATIVTNKETIFKENHNFFKQIVAGSDPALLVYGWVRRKKGKFNTIKY